MPFVGDIFAKLKAAETATVLEEIRDGQLTGVTGPELLDLVAKARTFLVSKKLNKGDRCGLLAANSIRWIAMDLAATAEGLIVVPLDSRQAPAELVAMMKDSTPELICCGDATLRQGIQHVWADAPPHFLFDEIFAGVEGISLDRPQVRNEDPVTIIYTSGTSGVSKGVVLTAANVGFMLGCTSARLDQLMGGPTSQDRVFHYLPFSFCASWIAVLTFMLRGSRGKHHAFGYTRSAGGVDDRDRVFVAHLRTIERDPLHARKDFVNQEIGRAPGPDLLNSLPQCRIAAADKRGS